MRLGVISLFVFLLLVSTGFAQQTMPTDTIEQKVIAVKYHVPFEIGGMFGTLFGNERIQIRVFSDDDIFHIIAVTKSGSLTDFDFGKLEKPTMTMDMTETTVNEIWTADRPGATAQSKLNSGAITYETHTVTNAVKMPVVSFFSTVMGWFS